MLTRRLVVYSPQDEFQFELSPNDVFAAKEVEEINGEHSITIVTTQHLEKEQRILTMDATEKWREYVVMGSDGQHDSNERPFGTYRGVWSLQHDFQLFGVDDVIGLDTPVTAANALNSILGNTSRWSRGTVTRSASSGANMTQINGWEALQLLIGNWGGELDVTITVSNEKVTSRKVDLYEKLGNQTATRRFDYRHDLTSMRRKVNEMPVACRIRPYGKGERTIDDIDVKITIEEVNDGKDYLQNDAMVNQLRLPDGNGGWEYPTINVTNTSIDDEEELLEWGMSVLPDYTTPKATYEASVSQLVAAGMGADGVELGDKTQCVDRDFDPDGGVRIESRVRKIENDLVDPTQTKLTLGDVTESYVLSVGTSLSRINSSIYDLTAGMNSTSEYLNNLLEHLNEQINATGGYTYITRGQGLRTYDRQVSDPLVGAEADAVVEIKGGTIRIANSKTAAGEWEWRTVFVSGHVAADLVTAANITTGFIGNASGSYWDLDNDFLQIASTSSIGDVTVLEALSNVYSMVSEVSWEYARNQSTVNPPSGGWSRTMPTWMSNYSIWARQAVTYGTGSDAYTVYGIPTVIPQNGSAGISNVMKQFYLSNSSTTQTGSSWSNTQPIWTSNKFIWTRLSVTWSNATTTYTTPELVMAAISISDIARSALDAASDAEKVATDYLTFSSTDGLDIGYSGTNAKTRINESGINVYDGNGVSALFAGIQNNKSIVRVGREDGSGNVVMSSDGTVDIRKGSTVIVHFGYGDGINASGTISKDSYYTIGSRKGSSVIGNNSYAQGYNVTASGYHSHAEGISTEATSYTAHAEGNKSKASGQYSHAEGYSTTASGDDAAHAEGYSTVASGSRSHAEGYNTVASGYCSHAEGYGTKASYNYSHAEGYQSEASGSSAHAEGDNTEASGSYSHAEGWQTKASGYCSHAEGDNTEATENWSHAEGYHTKAIGSHQHVFGSYNVTHSSHALIVGSGGSNGRSNIMYLSQGGNLWIQGTLTQNSDKRLKEHHAYLGEDAAEFVRKLRPALFTKDGERHLGFYAQDVQSAEPSEWDTATVTSQHTDESLDFDPLTLDYSALIAPLVAYAQSLEKRIDRQQKQIDEQGELIRRLTERLDRLEA